MTTLRYHTTTRLLIAGVITGVAIIVFIAMMLTIAITKQQKPLAPTAPTSKPGADTGLGNCSLGFDLIVPENPTPTSAPVCGNNRIEAGEECDDGNRIEFDGCNNRCQTEAEAWWQVAGGGLYVAKDNVTTNIPRVLCQKTSGCLPYLLRPDFLSPYLDQTAGVPQADTARFNVNGFATARSPQSLAVDTKHTEWVNREKYDGLLRRFDSNQMANLPESLSRFPEGTPQGNIGDVKDVLVSKRDGNLTLAPDSTWQNLSGKHVIFVSGNLTFIGSQHPLISLQPGAFLAFVVKGNIIFEKTVGTTNVGDTTPTVSGLYLADGFIMLMSQGKSDYRKFVGQGTFVGWSGVKLSQESLSFNNRYGASQLFIYKPDLIFNAPGQFKTPISRWQEVD